MIAIRLTKEKIFVEQLIGGGNGDLFGYSILNGMVQRDDIYVWNHENDSRTWVAPSLKTFMEWWESGKITI
ncbi:hypothetical protein BCE_3082 [Bacillus cereus ATCC 10987]|jgi:hypothetical protein|uniref:SMI1/KNR4 family protein n=1 Tax=Bacillus cereus (strain ATCC 10987 / NRS 248) TaxID=222523 RepID=Q735R9_BACC1|nr:hypothetical protein BCE_3082 [Bacillus cereus ATCC 10987]